MPNLLGKKHLITKDKMFDPLLAICPDFEVVWLSFVDQWSEDADDLPFYLLLLDLSLYMSELLDGDKEDEISAILSVAESWLLNGDSYVREAAVVGLLEGLQTQYSGQRKSPVEYIRLLPPECRYWWGKVERFWSSGELLIDGRQAT
ncbi:hypothetical protein SAMN04488518_10934 [Pseudovibrio ascidiaceicola]|uniref:DUF7674 domain-containing protein n=1 Tax=Pseudovibrio ascidiaceicola TaxID=285279 RepID=A0A1I4C9K5_9HYPH|nr:hypothetical protein [Pseudovibrio ascidiaceicola]SFK77854.1 hypothetical protein SAMN04488518_10934 [Pseudovibrio ascidiaceicola]